MTQMMENQNKLILAMIEKSNNAANQQVPESERKGILSKAAEHIPLIGGFFWVIQSETGTVGTDALQQWSPIRL